MNSNQVWVLGASLHTVVGDSVSLHTVFPMGSPALGGFTPGQISGLVMWYDASQIAGISSGASLSVWTDLSGSGSHLTSSGATRQPVYVSGVTNSLAVVRFNGGASNTHTYLQCPSVLSQPTSVFVVYSYQTTAINTRVVFDGMRGGGASMMLDNTNGAGGLPTSHASMRMFAGGTVTEASNSASTMSNGVFYPTIAVFNGSSSSLMIWSSFSNAGNVSTGDGGGLTLACRSSGAASSGDTGTLPGQVDIGEIGVYNVALTRAQQAQVMTYLKSKWGTE